MLSTENSLKNQSSQNFAIYNGESWVLGLNINFFSQASINENPMWFAHRRTPFPTTPSLA